MQTPEDIFEKIDEAERLSAVDIIIPVAFEPFSFMIVQEIKKLRSNIERNRLYYSILNDERTIMLYEGVKAKTVKFANHNTQDDYWIETLGMAVALNDLGCDVCFLPEVGDNLKGTKRADAIIRFNNHWFIADFKYFHSTNSNTLQVNLEEGFKQADTIVLKISNADAGTLKDSIDYLKRNGMKYGNIIVINEYNKILELTAKQIKTERYKYLIKGFL